MSAPTTSDPIIASPTTINPATMPAPFSPPPLALTLILAATPSLGIGKAGTLPWPQLKKEMGYFARVTKRVPPPPPPPRAGDAEPTRRPRWNAVVMGRKTWDSIPSRFRPLKGRVNVIVTRQPEMFVREGARGEEEGGEGEGPIAVGSVMEAMERLQGLNAASASAAAASVTSDAAAVPEIERVFVIGGAMVYDAALELPQTERVLLTKIREEFECDRFFSVDLDGDERWVRRGREELEEWTGESVGEGLEEKGVRFEFAMYERVGTGN